MPKKKDLKRLTRSRMRKTGESYTTARTRLLEKRSAVTPPAAPGADYAEIAGMSDAAVRAKTGRDWRQWVEVLDAVEAASLSHPEIARHVGEEHGIDGWWAQTVTVAYERIRGLRDVGQRRGGTYDANKSKTLPVPVARLYRAFSVARTRNRWLPGVEWRVRKATPEKSMRLTWEDGTAVDLYFTSKGESKSRVALQHRKLASRSDAEAAKEYWGTRLEALSELLAEPGSSTGLL